MAGLALALGGRPREVVLTDGNETSAINLENICQANSSLVNIIQMVTKREERECLFK